MIRVAGTLAALLFLTFTGLAAAFDGIRLTLLGTAESSTHGEPAEPGLVVEAGDEVLLFDCGAGTLKRLQRAHVLVRELTPVFLTGLDPTHVAGCGELLAARQVAAEAATSLWVPAGTVQAMQEWTAPPTAEYARQRLRRTIGENVVYDTDDVREPRSRSIPRRGRTPMATGWIETVARSRCLPERATRRISRTTHAVHRYWSAKLPQEREGRTRPRPWYATCWPTARRPRMQARIPHAARPYLAVFSRVQLFGVSEEEVVARRTRRDDRGPLQIGRDLMVVEIQNEVQIRSTPSDGPRQ